MLQVLFRMGAVFQLANFAAACWSSAGTRFVGKSLTFLSLSVSATPHGVVLHFVGNGFMGFLRTSAWEQLVSLIAQRQCTHTLSLFGRVVYDGERLVLTSVFQCHLRAQICEIGRVHCRHLWRGRQIRCGHWRPRFDEVCLGFQIE